VQLLQQQHSLETPTGLVHIIAKRQGVEVATFDVESGALSLTLKVREEFPNDVLQQIKRA
jgi:hypothetical protein